jgi:hypothetical protein
VSRCIIAQGCVWQVQCTAVVWSLSRPLHELCQVAPNTPTKHPVNGRPRVHTESLVCLALAPPLVAVCPRSTNLKKPQSHGPPDDWKASIPTRGSLSFDYVSTHPPGTKLQHTTWGLPPLASSTTGSRYSRAASMTGAAAAAAAEGASRDSSSTGAAHKAGAGAARQSVTGSAAGHGISGAGAGAGDEGPKAISTQQMEVLMRDQVGLWARFEGVRQRHDWLLQQQGNCRCDMASHMRAGQKASNIRTSNHLHCT